METSGLPGPPTRAALGIYLGAGDGGPAWTGPDRPTLVLGPSRSGKTSCLVVPNVRAAPGAVVSTSTKPDVMDATAAARGRRGWTLLFDPSGTIEPPPGTQRIGWSPVRGARHWDGALLSADAMVRATLRREAASGVGEASHWEERAAALLAPLLFAAGQADLPMRDVLSWVDRHEGSAPLGILAETVGDDHPASEVLAGILATDSREQSGIWSTGSGVLAAYRTSAARATTEGPLLDPDLFCAEANTLYICAPGRLQALAAPLVVGLVGEIRDAAYRRAGREPGGPPVLLALDEIANIAPLPDLPALVSEGAGQGLLTLACLQDLSQARARWGRQAEGFLSLFPTTVILAGIADMATLEAVSALGGEAEVESRTIATAIGRDGRLQRSVSVSGARRRRAPVDRIARGQPGRALVLDWRNRLGWVTLTPDQVSRSEHEGRAGPERRVPPGRGGGREGPG